MFTTFEILADNLTRNLTVRKRFTDATEAHAFGESLLAHATQRKELAEFTITTGDNEFVTWLANYSSDEVTPPHKCVIQETPDGMGCVTCLYT